MSRLSWFKWKEKMSGVRGNKLSTPEEDSSRGPNSSRGGSSNDKSRKPI